MINPLFFIDGYKLDHRRQYPAGTTRVQSNWTPRMSRVPGCGWVTFFGLQAALQILSSMVQREFFDLPRAEVLRRYRTRLDAYLGPQHGITLEHIEHLWTLGYLPLEFRALPEGLAVPLRVPALLVENTHDAHFWLPNYLETFLSQTLWLPCTSATTARRYRALLSRMSARTGGGPTDYQAHDFSARGMEGHLAAAFSGAAHLLAFNGTDTLVALDFIDDHYSDGRPDYCARLGIGASVPATEHAVMCAGGQEGEFETFTRLLDLYPSGIVSVVSDTWDLWTVLVDYLPRLKDRIEARDGRLVIRPDSGDPVKILCGDPEAAPDSPAAWGVIRLLERTFGAHVNAAGYKVLNPKIGAIYGDSITYVRAKAITERLEAMGYASTNVVLGIGSYTYQYVTRDTHGFAMKATWCRVNGEPRDIFKEPKTDDGTKHSAKGRLAVLPDYTLVNCATPEEEAQSLLTPVWRDGMFLRRDKFLAIRHRLQSTIDVAS